MHLSFRTMTQPTTHSSCSLHREMMVLEDHMIFWVLKEGEDCTISTNEAGRPLVGMAPAAPSLMIAGNWGCHVYPAHEGRA